MKTHIANEVVEYSKIILYCINHVLFINTAS